MGQEAHCKDAPVITLAKAQHLGSICAEHHKTPPSVIHKVAISLIQKVTISLSMPKSEAQALLSSSEPGWVFSEADPYVVHELAASHTISGAKLIFHQTLARGHCSKARTSLIQHWQENGKVETSHMLHIVFVFRLMIGNRLMVGNGASPCYPDCLHPFVTPIAINAQAVLATLNQ